MCSNHVLIHSLPFSSDKAPRVSWTCEHCTYVNNPGVKVIHHRRTQNNAHKVKEQKKADIQRPARKYISVE